MHGAIGVAKKNFRRAGILATIKGNANPAHAAVIGPTMERLAKAEGHFTVGDDKQGIRKHHMRDNPLDRALKKGLLSGAEHSALQKYRHHWFHAGQAPHIGSVDLNRIFSAEPGSVAGMPKTESQVFHRQRWREAQHLLGLRASAVVDMFACQEQTLEHCGQSLGWASKPQSIAGASEIVKDAGYRLAKLWGIG